MQLTEDNKRLLSDKRWRMNHLYKIVNKGGQLVVYQPNLVQDEYMRQRKLRNIILKGRQFGITTNACIDYLDDCLFNQHLNAVIIAHEEKAMEIIFKKVLLAWEKFYDEFGQHVGFSADTSRANLLSFNTGSTIRVALSTRGDTVHRLHISEFGKICRKYPDKAQEIITGALPSVPQGGRITIESTADGETGPFHDMFWEAYNRGEPTNELQYKAFFFAWHKFPDYKMSAKGMVIPEKYLEYQEKFKLTDEQIAWYYQTAEVQKEYMKREYPSTPAEAFESSGVKVFNPEVIEEHARSHVADGSPSAGWTFFEPYNPMHTYGIGADPAEGIGSDSSTAHLIDFSWRQYGVVTPKVVGVFSDNHTAPDVFAYELARAGALYGACIIGVERNGTGLSTLTVLKQDYPNLYVEHRKGNVEDRASNRLGFYTTPATKRAVIDQLKTAMNEGLIIVPDKDTLLEMRLYDEDHLRSTRYDENITAHLDRVMSLAIAYEMQGYATGGSSEIEGGYEPPSSEPFDRHAGVQI